jgi:hypothetical protein
MLGKVMFSALLLAAFIGMQLVLRLARGRWRQKNLLGAVRCPDCGTESSGYHCPACGQRLHVERLGWKVAGYLPFLIIVLLYLVLRRVAFQFF